MIRAYARLADRPIDEIIDCSANINPLGPPAGVWQALADALPTIVHYPDASHRHVKEVIATRFDISASSLICGNGAMEAMELVVRFVKPKRVVVLYPAFGEYEAVARRVGCEVVCVPLGHTEEGYLLPWPTLFGTLRAGDLLLINNPHNPSSRLWSPVVYTAHVQTLCERDVTVLIDESFLDFVPASEQWTQLPAAACTRNLYVLRSATKIFAIPGLRFGFAVGHPDAVQLIEAERDAWSVNALAQAAAAAAYQDAAFLVQTREWLRQEQIFIEATWGRHPRVRVEPIGVNFYLVHFQNAVLADNVTQHLKREGIWLRDCISFQGLDSAHRRIALKDHAVNARIWEIASSVL